MPLLLAGVWWICQRSAIQKLSVFLSNFPFPARSSSHTQDLFNHLHRKFLIKKRGIAYILRGGLVQAHLRTHVLQVLPTRIWKVMHFFASTFHESTPVALLSSKGSKLRLPFVMAPVPHFGTHFRHALQNSVMPESTAPAGSSGRSVKILEIRQRDPTLGLIKRPCLPSWPRPASTARGMLRAVSLAAGMALYPSPRINSANIQRVGAIRAYASVLSPSVRRAGAYSVPSMSLPHSWSTTTTYFISFGITRVPSSRRMGWSYCW